jgi:hypothetical protein
MEASGDCHKHRACRGAEHALVHRLHLAHGMTAAVIHSVARGGVAPNVRDYDEARRSFRWTEPPSVLAQP